MTLLHAQFGDIIENGWASDDNPTRTGFFVREGRRTGKMNPGHYFEVTDGAGKFWELPVDKDHKITVYAGPVREHLRVPATGEHSWTDKFGEHFEVRRAAYGRIFSRKITRDPLAGWTVTWDEVRQSVDRAIIESELAHR